MVLLNDSIVTDSTECRRSEGNQFRPTNFEAIDIAVLELDRRFSMQPLYETVLALNPTSYYFLSTLRDKLTYL